jgi:hypothetical protein
MLYVYLFKDRLDLQAKVDVAKDMDMRMKMKQFANMQLQVAFVLRPFLDFMYSFELSKSPQCGCFDVRSPI